MGVASAESRVVGECDRAGARWSREVGGVFGSVGFSRPGLVLWFVELGPSRNARGTSGGLGWARECCSCLAGRVEKCAVPL